MIEPHKKLTRLLLKVIAYDYPAQHQLLPKRWEIEHVFPQKWSNKFFPDKPSEEVQVRLEQIGNKIPLEKKLNIQASNGYFEEKQKRYRESDISIAQELGNLSLADDWSLKDIEARNTRVADRILAIFRDWGLNQNDTAPLAESTPSAEMAEWIKQLEKDGYKVTREM